MNVKAALWAKLSSDATLGAMLAGTASVFEAPAPQGSSLPYVTLNQQAEADVYSLASRSWEEYVFQVKAVTEGGSSALAGQISDRIDALLTDGTITAGGTASLYLRRTGQVDYPETADGKTYRHRGGLYRIHSQ